MSNLIKVEYEAEKLEERHKELVQSIEGAKKVFKQVSIKQMELEDFLIMQNK